MTSTTTGLAVAAVAALAAGALAFDTGTTAALWHSEATVAAQTIRAGSLAITSVEITTPASAPVPLAEGDSLTLTTTVKTLLDGTGLGGVLRVRYTWPSHDPVELDGITASATVDTSTDVVPSGSLTEGLALEVLLLPRGMAAPDGWTVLYFDGSEPTVTFHLTITSETSSTWALGAPSVSPEGPADAQAGAVSAELTQFSGGAEGRWSDGLTRDTALPVLYDVVVDDSAIEEEEEDEEAEAPDETAGSLPDALEPDGNDNDTNGQGHDGDDTDSNDADEQSDDGDIVDGNDTDANGPGDDADGDHTETNDPGDDADGDHTETNDQGDDADEHEGDGSDAHGGEVEPRVVEPPAQQDPAVADDTADVFVGEHAALAPGRDELASVIPGDDDGGDGDTP